MQEQKVTKPQLSKIHVLLMQLNLINEKVDFIYHASNGRATSSKDLTMQEASSLIKFLSQYDPLDRMRKKVFALAYDAGIIWGDLPEDKKINGIKLNSFLAERGTVRKELFKMSHAELVKTVTQFQQIVKHKGETLANKATKSLLDELSLQSSITQRLKTI